MPVRIPTIAVIVSLLAAVVLAAAPAPTQAAGGKVAIIVGPVGSLTNSYRARGDEVAAVAQAAGATVAKAYSPNATWENVKAAVNGANVVVYFGHGNGYPNPYGSTELTDRTNGWGLNRTTSGGDGDAWTSTLAYCGEKAMLGTLTASDGAVQRQYCAGGPLTPAPGFVMVYGQAHYAPGFGERYTQSTPITTLAEAQQRVRNYSYPIFALGGSGYFATAYSDAEEIVGRVLTDARSFGDLFRSGDGYSPGTLTAMAHPDVPGAEVWVQQTTIPGFHFGEADFWYAFAGNPNASVGGFSGFTPLPFSDIAASPFRDDIMWLADSGITGGCGGGRFCPDDAVTRSQMASFLVRALGLSAGAGANLFTDDNGSIHEADINILATSGITGGCGSGRFCPNSFVTRQEMASFLTRALGLTAGAGANLFWDDDGSLHEADIDRLATAGVTGGCGGGRYCPVNYVTRAQMAAFLRRAFS